MLIMFYYMQDQMFSQDLFLHCVKINKQIHVISMKFAFVFNKC